MTSPQSSRDSEEPEPLGGLSEGSVDGSSGSIGKSPNLLWGRKLRFWLIVLVALLWLLAHFIHSNHKARSSAASQSLPYLQSSMYEALALDWGSRCSFSPVEAIS